MAAERYELDLDTAPLRQDQLSERERTILRQIEDRLREVNKLPPRRKCEEQFQPTRYASAEDRRQRVLLLDGGRGTGKTSFLVTLINRWNRAASNDRSEEWSVEPKPPDHVRVIRILDFDPLPSGMPLLAAIVHSLRPLVQYYDKETFDNIEICDDDGRQHLMDDWHMLFRVAAAGWSDLPQAKSLLEEVLDRKEQVEDWQFFREHWLWFVDRVILTGTCLKKDDDQLKKQPVFVVVIDDVDLQVQRIRELLPALRLLEHPNVFFLVAADLEHLRAMLTLEFYGQQQQLASTDSQNISDAYGDRWAPELARASIEKVFPIRNRWSLEKLSLSEILRYPQPGPIAEPCSSKTIHGVLDHIVADPSYSDYWGADISNTTPVGDIAQALADAAEAASVALRTASYRSAQQLWQTVRDVFEGGERESRSRRSAELLARFVSPEDDSQAVVRKERDRFTVRVTTRGELSALYFAGAADRGPADDVVLSDRPEFLYLPDDDRPLSFMSKQPSQFNFSAGLLAKTLQELNFPVDATTLTWTTHLAMAWTRWRLGRRNANFAWPWYIHPRPDELLQRTASWAEYLRTTGKIAEQKKIRERHAYAWLYYEIEMFLHRRGEQKELDQLKALTPVDRADKTDFPWPELLAFTRRQNDPEATKQWITRTIPLLARPEIGLRPETQLILFDHIGNLDAGARKELSDERLKLATNAILVVGLQRGERRAEPPEQEVKDFLAQVEDYHGRVFDRAESLWHEHVEKHNVNKSAEAH